MTTPERSGLITGGSGTQSAPPARGRRPCAATLVDHARRTPGARADWSAVSDPEVAGVVAGPAGRPSRRLSRPRPRRAVGPCGGRSRPRGPWHCRRWATKTDGAARRSPRAADTRGAVRRAGRAVGRCSSRLSSAGGVVVGERPGRASGVADGCCTPNPGQDHPDTRLTAENVFDPKLGDCGHGSTVTRLRSGPAGLCASLPRAACRSRSSSYSRPSRRHAES